MGKELFCDLCRKSVAIETALKPITIGESKVCEVCLNCASSLEISMKRQITEAEMAVKAAQKAAVMSKQEIEKPAAKPAAASHVEEKPADKRMG